MKTKSHCSLQDHFLLGLFIHLCKCNIISREATDPGLLPHIHTSFSNYGVPGLTKIDEYN